MIPEQQQASPNILVELIRWIVALPAALTSAYIAYLVTGWSVRYGLGYAGVRADSPWVQLTDATFVHGCMGAAFVYIGALLAPRFKPVTSVVMCCLATVIAAILAFFAYQAMDWWALAGSTCVAVGAVLMLVAIRSGEVEFAF